MPCVLLFCLGNCFYKLNILDYSNISLKVMRIYHSPVMVQEVLESINFKSLGVLVDCTLGSGGHSEAILEYAKSIGKKIKILALDLDYEGIEIAKKRLNNNLDSIIIKQGNFSNISNIVKESGIDKVEAVLFDLGVSSLHLEKPIRGFSFRQDAELDMRFDINQTDSASNVINQESEETLKNIIRDFGEEPQANAIARSIVKNRPINSTLKLADIIVRAKKSYKYKSIHPATQTFQAIRMYVNNELDNINSGIQQAISLLKKSGRIITISYHSIEDRLVKKLLLEESRECICPTNILECVCNHSASLKLLFKKVIKPSLEEIRQNRRSRSAKLRVAEKI